MDVESAIDTRIEPVLMDTFGLSVARSLLTMATLAYATTVGGKVQRYRAFVDSVCTDERVLEKWGEAAAASKAKEWRDLVPLEPTVVVSTSGSFG